MPCRPCRWTERELVILTPTSVHDLGAPLIHRSYQVAIMRLVILLTLFMVICCQYCGFRSETKRSLEIHYSVGCKAQRTEDPTLQNAAEKWQAKKQKQREKNHSAKRRQLMIPTAGPSNDQDTDMEEGWQDDNGLDLDGVAVNMGNAEGSQPTVSF